MKLQVSLRTLALAGAALASLSWAGAAHAVQNQGWISPNGAPICADSGAAPNGVEASGFVNAPSGATGTFRLRNVTKAMIVQGPVTLTNAVFIQRGNGSPDNYRVCANNNNGSVSIFATVIINAIP